MNKNSCNNVPLLLANNTNKPGTLVPSATNVMAVTESRTPTVQPKCDAKSPIKAVSMPIHIIDNTKHK